MFRHSRRRPKKGKLGGKTNLAEREGTDSKRKKKLIKMNGAPEKIVIGI